MSTLTNNANNSSSSNSNNNNNSSSNNNTNNNNNNNSIASYYQQYIQHYQLSPQGGTAPPSAGGSPTVTGINNNNNGPTSDNIQTINNNNNNNISTSSSTSSNQSQPTTAANTGSGGGGGGVVGGILGVREVSAKLFLPFARAKMMHSSSSAASTPAKDQHQPGTPLDGTSMAGMNATPSGTPSATPGTTTGGGSSSSAGVSGSGAGRASSLIIPKALNVVLHGYHRKHKTNKKKYFVVYGDVPGKAARLEYFDSEKKFKQSFQKGNAGCDGGTQPKRTIVLRTCFNINKRHDLKKQIISLYTKDDSFCIVFESEEELNLWLRTLLRLQRGEDSEGDPPRPTFEHVWEVYVQRKGLGDSYGILGNYRLCITDKTLSLVRIGSELTPHQEKRAENVEFLLASVRRCGHSQRYFYLEVGRSSKTGAGEIWMEVQDSIIAQNMYTTIMKSAKSKDDNLGPMIRIRSSSANAASKPTSMLFRRQTHTGQKPINCSPSSEDQSNNGQNSESSSSATSVNTVVLVGSPPKAGTSAGLPYSAGAPGAKPRPPVVANPSLPACAENSSSLNTSTTSTITTAACTSTTAAAAAACSSSFVGPSQSSSDSFYHAPMIVPFAGITPAVSTGNVVASTPAAMFSSNSSLASIGSCSPSDAYVPLVPPGHGSTASTSQASGGGGGVPTRGGLVGSPRLGVTAQSPNYRRTTSGKKSTGSDAGGGSTTSPLQATRSHQPSRHYPQQPSTSSHHSHHPTHLPHPPPHHPAPYPHHGTQAVATGALVGPHPATPSVVSSSGCCSIGGSSSSIVSNRSSSNYSSNSSSTSTIAVTNEFSSSSTDHGVAIARERCDSLPSRNRTTSETMPHQQQQQQQQHLLNQQQQQHHHQLMLNSGSMPPPRMIPSSNRPHSVHISHSHSPPVNSSPLSPPPPATYSTGSDGSSLSIDESTDSFITGSLTPDEGQGYPKVINQLNSGCSIPEENSEEFIKDYGHIDLSAAGCGISQHDDFAVPTHHTAAPTSNATSILAGSSSSSAVGRVGHPHHNSLSLPISQAARRGGSPAPPSTVGSVEGSAYMEMCSPSGSSPGDPSGSCYMAMSPVADFSRGLCSSSSAHSRASSLAEDIVDGYVPMSMPRTAAAAPVAPPTEEYMLMDPTLNGGTSSRLSNATATSNNAGSSIIGGGGMSSAASSCSITSGTPSADLRLSLEKVPAYIGQSDEHEVNDRPFRTYSVGSRPELIKRKLRVEMLSSGESSVGGSSAGGSTSSRQRAFSVGSRAKVPRCSDVYKGYSAAPVIVSFASTSSQGSMLESSNNNSSSSTSSISHAGSYGASIGDTLPMDELAGGGSAGGSSMGRKSGSGSLLPDGTGGGKPPSHGGSHGRMSDLMEIDYSSPRQQPARPSTRSSEPSGMEDYLDMSGNNNEEEQRARGGGGLGATSSGYVEMRPGRLNSQSEENDYLNMTPGGGGRDEPDCCPAAASIATSSPIQIQHHAKQPADGAGSAHSSSSNNNNNNYLEMYPRAAVAQKEQKRTASATSTTTTATKVPSEDYLNMAPLMISSLGEASGSEEEKMHGPDEEPLLESSSAPPDGYMEMSWNHHGPVTAAGPVSSSASSSATSSAHTVPTNGGDDYMNMSCGSGSQSEDASRTYSAPITIQPGAGKCRLDLSGESKVEAGANIPNYLPLGQHPDARKSVHHPHHQSAMIVALQQHLPLAAQAPIQTTTGQQSGSIGFSPSKPAETTPERARCDSRDSGIVTPSGSQPTIFPFSPASPTKPFAPAQDEPMGGESLDDLSQNYAELSLGRQQQLQQAQKEPSPATRKLSTGSNRGSGSFSKLQLVANQPDYVNYCPATPPISGDVAPPSGIMPLNVLPSAQSRTRSSIDDDGAGDYALMNPASSRKLSTTSMGSMGAASLSPAGAVPPGSSAVGSITPPVLVARKSTLLLSSPQMGFKPIASSQDAELLLQSKAVPHATANSPKALNLGRRTGEPAFSFTEQQQQQQQMAPLQRSISTGTRPNSVNSELIGRPIGTPAGPSTPGAASHSSTTAVGSTRPSSANSERLPVISATSSSASSTSTLCESKNQSPSASSTALAMVVGGGSTTTSPPSVPGSRPDSVSSITDPHIVSRPPSVSSERELHYASLDLPPCSSSGKQTVAASPFAPGTMMLLAAAAAATTPAATSSAAAPVTKMDVDEPLPGSNEARTSIDSSSPSPTTTAGLQQQQPVRCAAFTYAQIDFVRSQAQSQQGQTGAGPAGASGPTGSTNTTTTSTPPQSSQA
ncbi:pneumococcal serine-rich repeat protein isoform X5 [Anopheles merus]|uniref:pneumococcal serine-rich repeat protein isoform X5 n=1 Tax=Anopheles merus TaxID=30066 RepID=UPI001BE4061E|nr:pneumococcal serine-rich repeat protein isoform X5 [Anopheles merus]